MKLQKPNDKNPRAPATTDTKSSGDQDSKIGDDSSDSE